MSRHAERRPGCWRNILFAATGMIAASLPFSFGQGSAGQQAQTTAAIEPSAQSIGMPDWQKVAGGKMSLDVASVRPTAPGKFRRSNIPMGADDSFHPTGGLFLAGFPLSTYIEFAYKLYLTSRQRDVLFAHLPKWTTTEKFTIEARGPMDATKNQCGSSCGSLRAEGAL